MQTDNHVVQKFDARKIYKLPNETIFSPPFLSVSPFLLLNLVQRQCYAYAIGLYIRPEIKSWLDVKFCAHAQCVLPRCSKIMASCSLGGVRTGIAKHHGRYSKSDHLCQDGEEWTSRRKRMWRRIFVKYAVEISDLPLFSSRDVCKNKGYRITRGKQCHSVNKCNLFEITRMQSMLQSWKY